MSLAERIAEQLGKAPSEIRALVELQQAAGNELIDVELGKGEHAGCVALVMNHPFRAKPDQVPGEMNYREWENNGLLLFEYQTADKRWSLLTAKFKPMKFEPITGPPAPPTQEEMQARRERIEDEHRVAREAAIAKVEARMADERDYLRFPDRDEPIFADRPPATIAKLPSPTTPLGRFRSSMVMTFDMWHDGAGYDLDALAEMSAEELRAIEIELRNRQPIDWRDVEALARIETPTARAAVVAALKHSDPNVRREAMHYAADEADPVERERQLLQSLQSDDLFGGLSQALDAAETFHPPAVIDLLLRGALNRPGQTAAHFAAMLFFIHGKANEPFDWDHRPFFLKFHTEDRKERKALFCELCKAIDVDAENYVT